MLLTTILNRCYRFKGFVYGQARFVRHLGQPSIEVLVRPRKGSRARCSGCGVRCAGYDHLPERRFAFIPLWGVIFHPKGATRFRLNGATLKC